MQRLHLRQAIISGWVELSTTNEYRLIAGLQMSEKTEKRRIDKDRKKKFDSIFLVERMERKKPKNVFPHYNRLKCLPNQRRHSTVFYSV